MPDYKLLGHNYTTPDLIAKVTGRAKYAEDYRADGMSFCKLLLSPMPHCRVRRIDASAALAMPRSEERRVGKEWRSRRTGDYRKKEIKDKSEKEYRENG